MREKMIKLEKMLGKRIFAAVLALLMILQCCIFMPLPVSAASYAEASGKLTLGNAGISYHQSLVDNGDGTYSLFIKLQDTSKISDENKEPNRSQNGYFTAPADGEYLVELWGGNGGDGVKSSYGSGGVGGAGGYVYGIVTMKKGDTLFYALGGNGQPTTFSDSGGGANGNGGNAGASTTYTIGGGGGYSAVFLFTKDDKFESKYLDENGSMAADFITEADRTSKYIMIAGGGGGGGAGSGNFLFKDDGNSPDGGNGGSMGSMSEILSDGSTCFYGDDGHTSGNSTAYTGKGATSVPGIVENTICDAVGIKWFAGIQPNDWFQSYNASFPGGNGGAGNLRGGSGGAGYCGGSGGVQVSIVYPTEVGGGGGASSYIAAGIDYTRSDIAEKLHTSDNLGGAIYITALTKSSETSLGAVSLTLRPSEYFTVSGAQEITNGEEGTGSYTVSDLNLTEEQTIELVFTPKAGFAGGNGVPLLEGNSLTIADTVNNNETTLNLAPDCAAVNVPLNFTVKAKSYMTNSVTQSFPVADLYEDNYADVRDSLAERWEYDFISSVGQYGVYETDIEHPLTQESVVPGKTTTYIVFFTVEPKSGTVAAVGTPVTSKTFTGRATISVVDKGDGWLGGNAVHYEKSLNYDETNETYVLSLDVEITTSGLTATNIGTTKYENNEDSEVTSQKGKYKVPASGYYFIQVWGGDGGGSIAMGDKYAPHGGYGAYLEGYVYLEKDTILDITVGELGTNGVQDGDAGTGGLGGGASTVVLNETTLMIAGGGGGAGGNYYDDGWFGKKRQGIGAHDSSVASKGGTLNGYNHEISISADGAVTIDPTKSNGVIDWNYNSLIENKKDNPATLPQNTSGVQGGKGTSSAGGTPGTAGTSYYDSTVLNQIRNDLALTAAAKQIADERSFTNYKQSSGSTGDNNKTVYNHRGGAVYITCLQVDSNGPGWDLGDYSYLAKIDRYWEVTGVKVTDSNPDAANPTLLNLQDRASDAFKAVVTTYADDAETFAGCSNVVIEGMDFAIKQDTKIHNLTPDVQDETKKVIEEEIQTVIFRVEIKLKTKDGFAGGNNVPILKPEASNSEDDMALTNGMQLRQKKPPEGEDHKDWLNINVAGQEATDYANVALNPGAFTNGLGTITPTPEEDRTIDKSKPDEQVVAPENIYQWSDVPAIPNDDSDWRYEFVRTFQRLTEKGDTKPVDGALDYDQSTVLTATVGICAKPVTEQLAVVIDPVTEISVSRDIEVIVLPRIQYILTNATTSDELTELSDGYYISVAPTLDHIATLKAAPGYRLDEDSLRVQKDGVDVAVTFDKATGRLTIPGSALISGTVVVTAEAVENNYTLTFMAQETPKSQSFVTTEAGSFKAGASLESVTEPNVTEFEGYEFLWDYGDGVTTKPTNMPGRNLIVVGGYHPKTYVLTIQYVEQGTETVIDTETKEVLFNTPYSFDAKQISGYKVLTPTITGELEHAADADIPIVIKCVPNEGNLTVTYQYSNGAYAGSTVVTSIQTGGTYNHDVKPVTGYTYKITDAEGNQVEQISGTVTAEDAETGLSFNVTYYPKRYTLTFNSNGGTLDSSFYNEETGNYEITVEYDNVFGRNVETGKLGFPRGTKTDCQGIEFWFIDTNQNGVYDEGEDKVDTGKKVELDADLELTAKWKPGTGYVVLRLVDVDGNNVYYTYVNDEQETVTTNIIQYSGDIGDEITITAPVISDYEVIENGEVTVTFTSSSQQVVAKYRSTVYTLTIHYVYADGSKAHDSYVEKLSVGTAYQVSSPAIDGYTPNRSTVSGTMGYSDYTTTVTYTENEAPKVISVTVTWSDLTFVYEHGKWNPETHTYEDPTITPKTNLGNRVTVKNNDESTVSVWAEYSFGAVDIADDLSGHYTEGNAYYTQEIIGEWLSIGQQQTVYFWLDGYLPREITGNLIVGSCKVTIRETEQGG